MKHTPEDSTKRIPISRWMYEVRVRDGFHFNEIPLSASQTWTLDQGRIRHVTGRYFSVVGLHWEEDGSERWQPFLDQQEVGTLGFVLRDRDGVRELLCHAKVEPGNVGVVQLAPTCQATRSNLERVHGGQVPPYAWEFSRDDLSVISDSLQSEQGSRFYRKRNRNIVIRDDKAEVCDEQHRWLPMELFAGLLREDYLVNTDARSVVVTSDWEVLFGRPLFPGDDDFSRALRVSNQSPVDNGRLLTARDRIQMARQAPIESTVCAVERMPGWALELDRPRTVDGRGCGIVHIATHCGTREVADWDQPMFSTYDTQVQHLLCAEIGGVLCFGFRCLPEPGLVNVAELAPSYLGELPSRYRDGRVHASVKQSDEGGRFLHDVTLYNILEIPSRLVDDELVWLSLPELRELLPAGYFNNEARSVLSILLGFA